MIHVDRCRRRAHARGRDARARPDASTRDRRRSDRRRGRRARRQAAPREKTTVDPAVGLEIHARLGDTLARGAPLATIHYRDEATRDAAIAQVAAAFHLTDPASPYTPPPMIHEVLR